MAPNPATDFSIQNYLPVLATAYGEGANQSYEAKSQILSTILNRAESGKAEFGAESGKITDVLKHGYYAYSNQSEKFKEAMSQKFTDKASEDSYKQFMQILSGMLKGNVKRSDALFFLTPKEAEAQKKAFTESKGKRGMNMDLLQKVDQPGDHIFFKYKDAPVKKVKK